MTTVSIIFPPCRTDTADFFSLSGYYGSSKRWTHYPLLVFIATDQAVEIQFLDSQAKVKQCTLPDNTPCLQQWGGQWSSSFFAFTLGEARAALKQ